MKTIPVFTKKTLTLANNIAIRRGYNRAIVEDYIAKMPEETKWAVTFYMLHEHAAGKPVDPHVRCMIQQLFVDDSPTLFVDTDMTVFEMLPKYTIDAEKETQQPTEAVSE